MGLKEEITNQWRTGGIIMRLILINTAVFLGLILINVLAYLLQVDFNPTKLLAAPADVIGLAKKPWTIITYMFTQEGFGHLFWNMLILYFLGRIFQDLLGGNRTVGVYVIGGVAGLALYVIGFNIFPAFEGFAKSSTIIGASASVMAVVFGIAAYNPNFQISLFIPRFVVKLWWIAAFYLISDIIAIQGTNPGGALAHIGGGLFGILFANQLKKGNDIAAPLGSWILGLGKKRIKRGKMRVEKTTSAPRKKQAVTSDEKEAKLNHILDKISKSGYDSLSKAEKDYLFKSSNE